MQKKDKKRMSHGIWAPGTSGPTGWYKSKQVIDELNLQVDSAGLHKLLEDLGLIKSNPYGKGYMSTLKLPKEIGYDRPHYPEKGARVLEEIYVHWNPEMLKDVFWQDIRNKL